MLTDKHCCLLVPRCRHVSPTPSSSSTTTSHVPYNPGQTRLLPGCWTVAGVQGKSIEQCQLEGQLCMDRVNEDRRQVSELLAKQVVRRTCVETTLLEQSEERQRDPVAPAITFCLSYQRYHPCHDCRHRGVDASSVTPPSEVAVLPARLCTTKTRPHAGASSHHEAIGQAG